MRYQAGDTVGAYRVTGILGEGAAGVVYQVVNQVTGRLEALKILTDSVSHDLEQVQRFLREIQLQARLEHPNIAQVRTAFCEGNTLVLVMEQIEGEALSVILQRGPLFPNAAFSIACQILDALAYAHAVGVIHRDIKPANILINRHGIAKITDFGLAKQHADPSQTATGIAVGTVFYMPPEQVRAVGQVDWRADLYAAGVVLYEMLTGRRPFDGPDHFAIMRAQMEQTATPPSVLAPHLPPAVDAIVLQALQKDPAQRFQSAFEFLQAIRSLATHTQTTAQRPKPSRLARRSWREPAAFVASAGIVMFAAFAVPRFDPKVEQLELPQPQAPPLPPAQVFRSVPQQAPEIGEPAPAPRNPPQRAQTRRTATPAPEAPFRARVANPDYPSHPAPKLIELPEAETIEAKPVASKQAAPATSAAEEKPVEKPVPAEADRDVERPAGWMQRTFGRWFRNRAPREPKAPPQN